MSLIILKRPKGNFFINIYNEFLLIPDESTVQNMALALESHLILIKLKMYVLSKYLSIKAQHIQPGQLEVDFAQWHRQMDIATL